MKPKPFSLLPPAAPPAALPHRPRDRHVTRARALANRHYIDILAEATSTLRRHVDIWNFGVNQPLVVWQHEYELLLWRHSILTLAVSREARRMLLIWRI